MDSVSYLTKRRATVYFNDSEVASLPKFFRITMRQVVHAAMRHLGQPKDFDMELIFFPMAQMRKLNIWYRGKDVPTDVLSFQSLTKPSLGSIYISTEIAERQAAEYGHSLERELAFLTVHGLLHLLGYDHETPEDEAVMTRIQEEILDKVGITR